MPPLSAANMTTEVQTRSHIRTAISLIVVWVCILMVGCQQDVQTIWSAEARSPDGHWLAIAHTIQHFGPGSAGIVTSVSLKRTNDSNSPMEILGFFHDGEDPSHTINLTMKWVSPTHLDVTYNGNPNLYFEVVKLGGIDISVRNLSV
jgi:hypothetical protein